jgi:hypothetical protein
MVPRASLSTSCCWQRTWAHLPPHIHRQLDEQVNEVKRMLNAFIKTLSPG